VVVTSPELVGESAGRRYREVAGRWIVRDRLMITGIGVEAEGCQTATGKGGQASRSGTEGFGVFQESDEAGMSGTGKDGNG